MIQWVYERASQSVLLDDIVVATDDPRIEEAVLAFGGRVIVTPENIHSGSDRVAMVAEHIPVEIVANIQGDEPLIDAKNIDQAVRLLLDNQDADVSTLAYQISDLEVLYNADSVRVVLDNMGYALYFSRAAIPFMRDVSEKKQWPALFPYYNHIGLYVFRKEFLLHYATLQQTPLEKVEKLEQLRILEYGFRIKVGITAYSPMCVDTPQDLVRVREEVKRLGL